MKKNNTSVNKFKLNQKVLTNKTLISCIDFECNRVCNDRPANTIGEIIFFRSETQVILKIADNCFISTPVTFIRKPTKLELALL